MNMPGFVKTQDLKEKFLIGMKHNFKVFQSSFLKYSIFIIFAVNINFLAKVGKLN